MGSEASRSLRSQDTSATTRGNVRRAKAGGNAESSQPAWSFVRGSPPIELLKLPPTAQKKFSTRSTVGVADVSTATNVFPCFRGGMLFRVVDPQDGGWHFYNDTSDMEMHIEYHFGPSSELDVPPHVHIQPSSVPGTEGWSCATMTLFPGETLQFISGASRVNGFRSVYRIAPLSDQVGLRRADEIDLIVAKMFDEMEVVTKLSAEMEQPATEAQVVDRCARQNVPFVDLLFPPDARSMFVGTASATAACTIGLESSGVVGSSLGGSAGNALSSSSVTSSSSSVAAVASSVVAGGAAALFAPSLLSAAATASAAPVDLSQLHGDARELHRRLPPVVWMRPHQFLTPEEAATSACIDRGVEVHDIEQGFLGDCWLLSAIAGVAEHADMIEWIFRDSLPRNANTAAAAKTSAAGTSSHSLNTRNAATSASSNTQVRSNNSSNAQAIGAYRVCLNVNGWWTTVALDDYLPCIANRPAFASNRRDRRELWPSLLEKAFAKLAGSYAALTGGDPLLAWRTLTGCLTSRFDAGWKAAASREADDQLFRVMLECRERGYLLCLNTRGVDQTFSADLSDVNQQNCQQLIARFEAIGLGLGHSYTILDVQYFAQWKLFLIKLRNPWGTGREWNGNWSDSSDMWERFPEVAAACKPEVKVDGIFWMSWEDALRYFDGGGVCFLRPLRWYDHRVMGQFAESHSTLCLELRVRRKTQLTFSLSQRDAVAAAAASGNHGYNPSEQVGLHGNIIHNADNSNNDHNGSIAQSALVAMMLSIATPIPVADGDPPTVSVLWNSTTNAHEPSESFTFTFARDLGIVADLEPHDEPYYVVPRVFDAGVNKNYVLGVQSEQRAGCVGDFDDNGSITNGAGASDVDGAGPAYEVRFVEISSDSVLYMNRRIVQLPLGSVRPVAAPFQIKTAEGVAHGFGGSFSAGSTARFL